MDAGIIAHMQAAVAAPADHVLRIVVDGKLRLREHYSIGDLESAQPQLRQAVLACLERGQRCDVIIDDPAGVSHVRRFEVAS